jgi:hypothetical protein
MSQKKKLQNSSGFRRILQEQRNLMQKCCLKTRRVKPPVRNCKKQAGQEDEKGVRELHCFSQSGYGQNRIRMIESPFLLSTLYHRHYMQYVRVCIMCFGGIDGVRFVRLQSLVVQFPFPNTHSRHPYLL